MPNLEWGCPQTIVSPYAPGGLALNTPLTGQPPTLPSGAAAFYQVMVDGTGYKIVTQKFRAVVDSLSQTDGSTIQPPYIDGLVASIELAYMVCPGGSVASKTNACAGDLRAMDDYLMGVLNSLRTYPPDVSTQQYLWLPTGLSTQRLLDGVMLGSWPTPDFSKGPPEVRVQFDLACPYPYALTDAPHTTVIAASSAGVAPNNGNTSYLPVINIPGPFTSCGISNSANGGTFSYNSSLPGALAVLTGHTLQIDMHEGSCLLDGNPALDYIAGLDPTVDNFFPLVPVALGTNTLTVTGAGISVVSYDSWA